MTKLQSLLYIVLVEIDRICKKHAIQYFLVYGTALGAVRHQGFIPWDDDLDVAMLRPDYERFIRACQTELPLGMFLQHWTTEAHFYLPYAKICVENTTFMSPHHAHLNIHHSLFVDIFPLDGVPASSLLSRMQLVLLRCLRIMLEIRFANLPNPRLRNRLLTRWVRPLLSGKLINHLFNIIACGFSVKSAARVRNMFLVYGEKQETCNAAWFAMPAYLNFENGLYPVPYDPDAYLQQVYGDYMVLPPVDRRKNNHASIIDLDHCATR